MMNSIKIQDNVNPHFKAVWKTNKPYIVLKGGRNSFKSSVIALLLVYKMIKYIMIGEKANIVVIRKVANTLRDSVFLKIQWALNKFNMMSQFTCTVSPFKITHNKTGSTFYFYGQDDFQKLKSNDIGNIIAVWFNISDHIKLLKFGEHPNVKARAIPSEVSLITLVTKTISYGIISKKGWCLLWMRFGKMWMVTKACIL